MLLLCLLFENRVALPLLKYFLTSICVEYPVSSLIMQILRNLFTVRKKFHFNADTLSYEQIQHTIGYKLVRVLWHTLFGLFSGVLFFFVFVSIVRSPEEKELIQEKSHIEAQYNVLEKQFNEMQRVVSDLQDRDDNLYRVIFQAEPIPLAVRKATASNTLYYKQLLNMTNSEIVVTTSKTLAELKKEIYIQSKSYDELVGLTKTKEIILQHLPAIQPILNKDLKRMASGYGWRMDPIYHTPRFHAGMDFTAPIGTDIYATADGVIASAGWEHGYGYCVQINHGYGYLTLYGHLSSIKVQRGQKVTRGYVIGLVGNTGKSTGPHLHYEVHYRGNIMNPQNYYFLDLSPKEYDKMVEMTNNSGQMFD